MNNTTGGWFVAVARVALLGALLGFGTALAEDTSSQSSSAVPTPGHGCCRTVIPPDDGGEPRDPEPPPPPPPPSEPGLRPEAVAEQLP
jgi:hypothetical protein